MVQNMPYDKQRKGCFIKESSDDEDDRDDKYDSGIFHDRMHKICVALNKEKGFASFWHPVTIRTIRTMITTAGLSMIGCTKFASH